NEDQRVIEGIPVDALHDQSGGLVAMARNEGQESAQCPRVGRRVGAVASRGPVSVGQDPGCLVVPDRLGGQSVPAGEVNRPESTTVLKVLPHANAHDRGEVSTVASTILFKGMTAANTAYTVDAATVMRLLARRPSLLALGEPTHGEDVLLE